MEASTWCQLSHNRSILSSKRFISFVLIDYNLYACYFSPCRWFPAVSSSQAQFRISMQHWSPALGSTAYISDHQLYRRTCWIVIVIINDVGGGATILITIDQWTISYTAVYSSTVAVTCSVTIPSLQTKLWHIASSWMNQNRNKLSQRNWSSSRFQWFYLRECYFLLRTYSTVQDKSLVTKFRLDISLCFLQACFDFKHIQHVWWYWWYTWISMCIIIFVYMCNIMMYLIVCKTY